MDHWPRDQRFLARDKTTQLVHVAREYEMASMYDPIIEHATWCGITVTRRDFALVEDDAFPTCLACATEAV